MKSGQVVLSDRLEMLAGMVTRGNRAVDVGCDHGFLSVCLIQREICPHVLATDVRRGPLAAAAEHVQACGLEAYIEIRLSDGLKNVAAGEADTVVCAGMGGPLMARILTDSMEKVRGMKELILQPQSQLREFRAFLRAADFCILDEDAVWEDGKYYFAMKAVCGSGKVSAETAEEQRMYDEYGKLLLERRHPVLRQYLLTRKETVDRLLDSLTAREGGRAAKRLEELRREQAVTVEALRRFQ
ncbi:MAG: class I SAM-dependent methyltransferase [bacterium]|nr:class I SAM-dependent methyltransferase [bacterium]